MENLQETVTIESLAYGGDAVTHIHGKVVFVPGCVPGDVVRLSVTEDRGSFLRGKMTELLSPSPSRAEPFCPYAESCGGCQWQAVSYPEQLRWKRSIVEESMRRIGGLTDIETEPCLPSSPDRGVRTVVRYRAWNPENGLVLGYYERRSHRVVDITYCPMATEGVNEIARYMREHGGELFRGIDIREATVRASQHHPSALLTVHTVEECDLRAAAQNMLDGIPGLAGIVHRLGDGRHIETYGEPFRYERIGGTEFRIEERSFFQANVVQAARLTALVKEMLGTEKTDTVVDGYGGVGLFSLTALPDDAAVHLCDSSWSAVKDSIFNARRNGFKRFTAYAENTAVAAGTIGTADALILDPPRPGLGEKTVHALCRLGAETIVYVSCNPATLARDAGFFQARGYAVERVVPVDMFPHTYHIETVMKLKRR